MLTIVSTLLSCWAFLLVSVQALSKLVSRPFAHLSLTTTFRDNQRKTVCVVGGGFGGLYSAISIGKMCDSQTDVYLIDPKENFVFLPLLYELAVGTASTIEVAPKYEGLLSGYKVKCIRGKVLGIDCGGKTCTIEACGSSSIEPGAKTTLRFDQLVLAAGIQPRTDMIRGAAEHAHPFYTVDDAIKLKAKLRLLNTLRTAAEKVNVAVIGGGYGGVEVAANVAEYLGQQRSNVTIIDRNERILSPSTEFNRNTAHRVLLNKGVTIKYNTTVECVEADGLVLRDGQTDQVQRVDANLILFTAGTEQNSLVKSLSLTKDKWGRILTKRTLQMVDYPYIYAVGDCSSVCDDSYPATAQVAMQQASTVAHNVVESIRYNRLHAGVDGLGSVNKYGVAAEISASTVVDERAVGNNTNRQVCGPKLREFRFFSLGEMLSLGDTNATITSLGGWVTLSGPIAALGRRAAYALRMPTLGQTMTALVSAGAVTSGKLLSKLFMGGNVDTIRND